MPKLTAGESCERFLDKETEKLPAHDWDQRVDRSHTSPTGHNQR